MHLKRLTLLSYNYLKRVNREILAAGLQSIHSMDWRSDYELWLCEGLVKGAKRAASNDCADGVWDRQKNIYMDKQSGKDFDRPRYKRLVKSCTPAICWSFRVLTGWAATMGRFWSSGESSPRKSGWTSLFWTCLCWIRGPGAKT